MKTKFRAWDFEVKHMYYPPNEHITMWCDGVCINLQTGKELIPLFWTGLKDINNKEVYEEDIIGKDVTSIDDPAHGCYYQWYIVRWRNGEFFLLPLSEEVFEESILMIESCVLMGNTYENPELKGDEVNDSKI
jgi:hypothetical protein